jgi:hypothetical protein
MAYFSIGGLKGIGISNPQTLAGGAFNLPKVFFSVVTRATISAATPQV